jgi:cobalamin biosynthesis protein CobC
MKHGGDLAEARARYGGEPEDWLDLSTGINPHPYPLPALDPQAWTRLPSRADAQLLEDAASAAYGVPSGLRLVPAPGTQALIQWLPRLAPPGAAAILGPTYSEHAAAWRAAGRTVHAVRDADALPAGARHVVVVNPNNPDGRVLGRATLRGLADVCAAREGWLVVDESFADLDPALSIVPDAPERPVVVLRSFGKFYGLAGVRLGFAVARPDIAEAIAAALGPWAVSGPALGVGRRALADAAWAAAMRARLAQEARALDAVLACGGLAVVGGTALYRLARRPDAVRLQDRLARSRIWVRRFDWADDLLRFGLPGSSANLDRLAAALSDAHR